VGVPRRRIAAVGLKGLPPGADWCTLGLRSCRFTHGALPYTLTNRSSRMPKRTVGPFPPLPAKITIPNIKTTSKVIGTTQIPGSTPFYYAAITSLWVHWRVDLAVLTPYVSRLGLLPGNFGGKGLVNVNFFNALAQYGSGQPGNSGGSVFNETEVNIVAYPKSRAASVPTTLTPEEYLAGADQTKVLGNYRLWVACDDPIAVAAGRQLYFENKYLTAYTYDIPAMNNAGVSDYTFACHDPKFVKRIVYKANVDVSGMPSVPGNVSEWIDYSYATSLGVPVASRRNYFGMYATYLLGARAKRAVKIRYGNSKFKMKRDMQAIIGQAPAFAVQTFQSPTVIAEARPYYADA
jgi:hypothetical protein